MPGAAARLHLHRPSPSERRTGQVGGKKVAACGGRAAGGSISGSSELHQSVIRAQSARSVTSPAPR
eukprot:scaffold669_cov82-Phaeocystis_antarctica.AAC.1